MRSLRTGSRQGKQKGAVLFVEHSCSLTGPEWSWWSPGPVECVWRGNSRIWAAGAQQAYGSQPAPRRSDAWDHREVRAAAPTSTRSPRATSTPLLGASSPGRALSVVARVAPEQGRGGGAWDLARLFPHPAASQDGGRPHGGQCRALHGATLPGISGTAHRGRVTWEAYNPHREGCAS